MNTKRVALGVPSELAAAQEQVLSERRRGRMLVRRRRAAMLAVTLTGLALVGVALGRRDGPPGHSSTEAAPPSTAAAAPGAGGGPSPVGSGPSVVGGGPPGAGPPASGPLGVGPLGAGPLGAGPSGAASAVPLAGAGTFGYATTTSPVRGVAGELRRYRVAVEDGLDQRADPFAEVVDEILGDARGWTAGGNLRLQRVGGELAAEFTVFLASPATSKSMCAAGGLSTDGYSSCRLPGKAIINLARWQGATPDYGAPLATYRGYVINHEVGHELGNGHEACPGPGQLAPVMQQQTLGLNGCRANAWPYVDGNRYAGSPVP